MNSNQVMNLLKTHQNQQGIQNWEQLGPKAGKLKSFGIGLTILRKLAKQIGRNHTLAQELWESDCYDARIIALLIDDPKLITREQAEAQVEKLNQGYLAHVFSSCDATLAKTSFATELACEWIISEDSVRRGCGYGLLYEASKSKKKSAPEDAFFLARIAQIEKAFFGEVPSVQLAMGCALMGIGKRSRRLNAAALKVARKIGPIPVTSGKTKCDPFDVEKHLTSSYVTGKLGL